MEDSEKDVKKFVLDWINKGRKTGLLVEAFEEIVMQELCKKGQQLLLAPLNNAARERSGRKRINLRKATIKRVSTIEDIDVDYPEPVMWAPNSESFPVVNFVYTQPAPSRGRKRDALVIGFRVSVQENYRIRRKRLEKLTDVFDNRIMLVFALPKIVYADFTVQTQVEEDEAGCAVDKELLLPQYKMCVAYQLINQHNE